MSNNLSRINIGGPNDTSTIGGKMKITCRAIGLFLALAVAFASVESTAQSYPNRPIKLIVGYPPGGTNDILPRIVSPRLSEQLGQPVVVENKPGADALIATEFVARASPDGYTLLVGASGQMVYNPALWANNPSTAPRKLFDPLKDFVPITMIGSDPIVFAVHPSVKANTIKDLIALAKANPGKMFYSSGGPPFFVATETFKRVAGVDLIYVPYKGSAASVNGAVAGEVQVHAGSVGPALSQLRAGKLRPLAVTSAKRDPVLPDVPTVRESGLDFEGGMWTGLYAPAGTSKAIIDKLYSELSVILKSDAIKNQFATLGYDTNQLGLSPEELGAYHRSQLTKWTKAIKDYNIRVSK
ncbi:MAG: tripartite tricarboxylate transporter substrate binding protein [Betaproteobacteria bacterium]|nr:tripartite tricarboxylate transporter substrate binding protein [Betaproteobacteria bacterium]